MFLRLNSGYPVSSCDSSWLRQKTFRLFSHSGTGNLKRCDRYSVMPQTMPAFRKRTIRRAPSQEICCPKEVELVKENRRSQVPNRRPFHYVRPPHSFGIASLFQPLTVRSMWGGFVDTSPRQLIKSSNHQTPVSQLRFLPRTVPAETRLQESGICTACPNLCNSTAHDPNTEHGSSSGREEHFDSIRLLL